MKDANTGELPSILKHVRDPSQRDEYQNQGYGRALLSFTKMLSQQVIKVQLPAIDQSVFFKYFKYFQFDEVPSCFGCFVDHVNQGPLVHIRKLSTTWSVTRRFFVLATPAHADGRTTLLTIFSGWACFTVEQSVSRQREEPVPPFLSQANESAPGDNALMRFEQYPTYQALNGSGGQRRPGADIKPFVHSKGPGYCKRRVRGAPEGASSGASRDITELQKQARSWPFVQPCKHESRFERAHAEERTTFLTAGKAIQDRFFRSAGEASILKGAWDRCPPAEEHAPGAVSARDRASIEDAPAAESSLLECVALLLACSQHPRLGNEAYPFVIIYAKLPSGGRTSRRRICHAGAGRGKADAAGRGASLKRLRCLLGRRSMCKAIMPYFVLGSVRDSHDQFHVVILMGRAWAAPGTRPDHRAHLHVSRLVSSAPGPVFDPRWPASAARSVNLRIGGEQLMGWLGEQPAAGPSRLSRQRAGLGACPSDPNRGPDLWVLDGSLWAGVRLDARPGAVAPPNKPVFVQD
ncbi:hypothetical protein DFH11DRAFT_1539041 [Phellopilus nigrolimitatus]|nr:hypothetical protein DFH11DRAFT_1539041 [Phellopilus nigrolimitatus]